MSREMFLTMDEGAVIAACLKEHVGVSSIERLPQGGVRLVCMSSGGAETMRQKFKKQLLTGNVTRERVRPARPLW